MSDAGAGPDPALAREVIELLVAGHETVGVAESLTGGMLAAALTAIPGASAAFRGAVVAYATELMAAIEVFVNRVLDAFAASRPAGPGAGGWTHNLDS